MSIKDKESIMGNVPFYLLLSATFTMAFNLPAGRSLLALSFALLCWESWKKKEVPQIPAVFWYLMVFCACALISSIFGVDPISSLKHLRKLIWFLIGIPVYAIVVNTTMRLTMTLGSFSAGCAVLAVYDAVRNSMLASEALHNGVFKSFTAALTHYGSMTDAQRLMAGIIITIGLLILYKRLERSAVLWWIILGIQSLGILISFKRGSLICLSIIAVFFIWKKIGWRYTLGIIGVICLIGLLPPVFNRISDLKKEMADKGGRVTMWTKVAPALHREHPWLGVGWRGVTEKMMVQIAPNVEKNRTHLHSNYLEVLVELGWIGLAAYIIWMFKVLVDALRFMIEAKGGDLQLEMSSIILFLVFIGLLANGIVEYNLADGELVVIYAMIMGCASTGIERLDSKPEGIHLNIQ